MLNAVEGFFAKLSRRGLNNGVFCSVVELHAPIDRFVAEHNQSPKPFAWRADPYAIIAASFRGFQVLESVHQSPNNARARASQCQGKCRRGKRPGGCFCPVVTASASENAFDTELVRVPVVRTAQDVLNERQACQTQSGQVSPSDTAACHGLGHVQFEHPTEVPTFLRGRRSGEGDPCQHRNDYRKCMSHLIASLKPESNQMIRESGVLYNSGKKGHSKIIIINNNEISL